MKRVFSTALLSLLFAAWASTGNCQDEVPGISSPFRGEVFKNETGSILTQETEPQLSTFATTSVEATSVSSSVAAISPEDPLSGYPDVLANIVKTCGNDPVKMFNLVHDHVAFTPYYGLRKGSELTWITRSGNDADQADLLCTLFKAAGLSPLLEELTCTIPLDVAERWFGVDSPEGLDMVTATADYYAYVNTVSQQLEITLFAVKLSVGGSEYRFLPAFKEYVRSPGINLGSALQYSGGTLMASAGGSVGGAYVKNVSEAGVSGYLQSMTMSLISEIRQSYPNAALSEVLGGCTIVPSSSGQPSDCFPASVNVVSARTFSPSDPGKRDWFEFGVYEFDSASSRQGLVDVGGDTRDFLGPKRISVTFDSEGRAELWSDDILLAREPLSRGLPENIVLYVNIAHRGARGNGVTQPFNEVRRVPIKRGGTYVIVTDFGGMDQGALESARRAKLAWYQRQGKPSDSREVISEKLNLLGITWAKQWEQATKLIGSHTSSIPLLHHSINVVSQSTGAGVDITAACPFVSRTGDLTTNAKALKAATLMASAMEGANIEEQYPGRTAVSSVAYTVRNNAQGKKTFLFNRQNYDSVKSDPDFMAGWSEYYRESVFPRVLLGLSGPWTLVIPEDGNQQLGKLIGNGFFVASPTSVSASISRPEYVANGGWDTSGSTLDDPINLTLQTGTPGPEALNNPMSLDPIDLYSGAWVYDHEDLALGGDEPRGLHFARFYSSAGSDSRSDLGFGWNHSYRAFLTEYSDSTSAFAGSPEQVAGSIAATYALCDLAQNYSDSAKGWVVAAIVSDWAMQQVKGNTVSLTQGRRNFTFTRIADGTYTAAPGITAQLVRDGITGLYKVQERFGRELSFDADLKISSYRDADGKSLFYYYDPVTKKLSSVTDCYNRTLSFQYIESGANAGLLQNVSDSTGRLVHFTYTGSGQLETASDPEGYATTYSYNSDGKLAKIIGQDGKVVAVTNYDKTGRVREQLAEGDQAQSWKYSFCGPLTTETNPNGDVTSYFYDSRGRNVATVDGGGNCTKREYDAQDHLVKVTDANGHATQFQYDGYNNLRFIIAPDTHTKEMVYDTQNRLDHILDQAGKRTGFEYDSENHLKKVTDPELRETRYEYYSSGNSDGLIQNLITATGTTTYTYDSWGNPETVTRPDGSVLHSTYNARGECLHTHIDSMGDPNTHSMNYAFDKRGLLLSSTDALGFTTMNSYDQKGQLVGQVDRTGRSANTSYSPLGKVTSVTAPGGITTSFGYDTSGRKVSTTDALNQISFSGYDDAGRLVTGTDALNHGSGFGYDAAGNKTSFTNTRGKTWTWGYTNGNLIASATTAMGHATGYWYNSRGLLETKTEPSLQTTTLSYWNDGKLKQLSDEVGTIDYAYDANGRLWTVTENGSTISREYDSLDRLIKFTDAAGNVLQYKYDGAGNLIELTYPDGVKKVTYVYDAADRLDYVKDWAERTTDFQYDEKSRLSAIVFPNGTQRIFGYDAAGRINLIRDEVTATHSAISQSELNYDALGRIERENVSPVIGSTAVQSATMTYDDDDRLATWEGQTCVSDDDGNLTTGPLNGVLAEFSYDNRNRLTSAVGATYGYDAENRRTSQITVTGTTTYVHDPQGSLSRLLVRNNGNATTRYVYAGGALLYQETENGISIYHSDYRGSTVAISDGSGAVTDLISYGPYGEVLQRTGVTDTPFLYDGAYGVETDLNGLICMRARYYGPGVRRFFNMDPIQFKGGDNLYSFVGGDPIGFSDPHGLDRTLVDNGHEYVVVDLWNDSGTDKVGRARIDFGPDLKTVPINAAVYALLPPQLKALAASLAKGAVYITIDPGADLDLGLNITQPSDSRQDKELLDWARSAQANPELYNTLFHNCRHFASQAFYVGIDNFNWWSSVPIFSSLNFFGKPETPCNR